MTPRYLTAFVEALCKYQKQQPRPGYSFGIFSAIRHRNHTHPLTQDSIAALEQSLSISNDDEHAKQALITYLQAPNRAYHNHSFTQYLLDALSSTFPDDDWRQYDPKSVVYYSGTVYRGCQTPPSEAFELGINPTNKPISDPNKVVSLATFYCGIATSKYLEIARMYATRVDSYFDCTVFIKGYVYVIEVGPKNQAVDITETKQKQSKWSRFFCMPSGKDEIGEVTVMHKILPENIRGCYDFSREEGNQWIENPNFRGDQNSSSLLTP